LIVSDGAEAITTAAMVYPRAAHQLCLACEQDHAWEVERDSEHPPPRFQQKC
jgi:hypothetical protein